MKKLMLVFGISLLAVVIVSAQGYKVGDKATDFKLKNVDGKMVSLKDFSDAKGFVVVFTCNNCPYAKAYQDRLIELDKKYKTKGYPVVAINPNDVSLSPEDSYDKMVHRAKEKKYSFPYLIDETQYVYRAYGAEKTPHTYLLQKNGKDLVVKYIGAIDDNYQDPSSVSEAYLTNAIDAVIAGNEPQPATTKAIGCGIKDKAKRT
jgi:peroxiredoxin